MAALKGAKREIRQWIKRVLAELSSDAISSQTFNALKTLFNMPEYQEARRISVYMSMPSGEVSTTSIVRNAFEQQKRVFVPYIYRLPDPDPDPAKPKSIMDVLELRSLTDYGSLKPDKWGIPSLDEESIPDRSNSFGGQGLSEAHVTPLKDDAGGLDLVVVPGMAFDSDLGRLGHGKGYYDYFLERCAQQSKVDSNVKMPFIVGLALKEQLLPQEQSVPMDSTDRRLDALVVGDGRLIRARCR